MATLIWFPLVWFPLVGLAVSRHAGRMNVFLAGAGMNGLVLFIAGVLHVPLAPTLVAIGVVSIAIGLRGSAVARLRSRFLLTARLRNCVTGQVQVRVSDVAQKRELLAQVHVAIMI